MDARSEGQFSAREPRGCGGRRGFHPRDRDHGRRKILTRNALQTRLLITRELQSGEPLREAKAREGARPLEISRHLSEPDPERITTAHVRPLVREGRVHGLGIQDFLEHLRDDDPRVK